MRTYFDWAGGIRGLVAEIADARRSIAGIKVGDAPEKALEAKRSVLAEAELRTGQLRLFADLAVGAALAHASRGLTGLDAGSLRAAKLVADAAGAIQAEALTQRRRWLDTDRVDGSFERAPLHWPLVFPEVLNNGGFDAIVGNPPFLGGKLISAPLGSAYRREYLVQAIAHGVKGSADLVAYFFLRAHSLLGPSAQFGLLSTNSLVQHEARPVCLDQLTGRGATLCRAIKDKRWIPGSASVDYCSIWMTTSPLGDGVKRWLDGREVEFISNSLDDRSESAGRALTLSANENMAFMGSIVGGDGFVLEESVARELLRDPLNNDVVKPFLGGKDITGRPDSSPSRYVINFFNWDLETAKKYSKCLRIIERTVKPVRDAHSKRAYRERWWQYSERCPGLYESIRNRDRVIALSLTSSTVAPVFVPADCVFSNGCGIVSSSDEGILALLSSAAHFWWIVSEAPSSLQDRIRYTTSAAFLSFPMCSISLGLREAGIRLDAHRRNVMVSRQAGLTKTYNLVNRADCVDSDIVELRMIHKNIDEAVLLAYGWDDLLDELDHGFRSVARETRFTIGPAAQRAILDRLLKLNHERYAEEVAQGLHDKRKGSPAKRSGTPDQDGLFQA